MGYWHQMFPRRQKAERVELDNGSARFESLMSKELSERDRKFAESLQSQFNDQGKLSPKQVECVERLEQRYSDEAIVARNEWEAKYKANHREVALICAKYYRTTAYFRDLATRVLLEEDFVPTEKQFNALTKNKYAKKAIAAATEPPAFPIGSLCKVRANYNLVQRPHLHNQIGLVVANHPTGLYASSTILVNGEQVKLEDRCLKSAGKKKK
jgi:hypothetical protein